MNNQSRPLIPVNPQGLDEIAKALLESTSTRDEGSATDLSDIPERDRESYMILEGREHKNGVEKYEYGDLFVGLHRLGMNPSIERIKSRLGFNIANTAQEQDGTSYIGGIDWNEGLKLNLALGGKTLNPRQGIDFLSDLNEGRTGKRELFYASGKKIPKDVLNRVYNEITEVRDPYRAEWFDADFKMVNGILHINFAHELRGGVLVPRFSEPLESYLDEKGKKVAFADFNRQGLATKASRKGEIQYWSPDKDNNSVARFVADSGRAYLGCYWNPAVRVTGLGVRPVRAKN